MSISENSVENILTDDATPNPRYKPITNIFSFLRETVLTRALRHRRWKGLEFSRSLLFIDLESTGIELHGGIRDCPYINILEIYLPGSYHMKQIPWVLSGFWAALPCGFAVQSRGFPTKLKITSVRQGRKHKVPFGTSFILCQDIFFLCYFCLMQL